LSEWPQKVSFITDADANLPGLTQTKENSGIMTYPNLLQGATPGQLERAAAFNHQELFNVEAGMLGGDIHSSGGLSWTMAGMAGGSMIPFPVLSEENAGKELDRLINSYLKHPPKGAGCWSLDPPQPIDLGVRLLARGFQPGWRPCWMGLDLQRMQTEYPAPGGLTITLDNHSSLQTIKNLPYAQVIIPSLQSLGWEGRWARFVASLNGKVVAQCVVFLTTGELGAAGIYHVGVVPRARHLGVGKAVTMAACLYAREKGYRYAVLNATDAGRRMYEQLGFACVGEGWTWWMITERLLANPPTPRQVSLAEGIGRGDLAALDALRPAFTPEELNRPLTNGMTLMQLAVHCRQPAAGEWLISGGASFTVLDAWDLGWKDCALQQLREQPGQVNQLYGEWNKTLLHFAAERNDEELTRLALSAGPDLSLEDSAYRGTALGWAQHFGHTAIIRLIEAYKK
jgi:GNAT superfamily N-acetyltransferase